LSVARRAAVRLAALRLAALRLAALLLAALPLGCALLLVACESGSPGSLRGRDDVSVWRFAIEETAGSVQDAYAQELGRRIASRSDGRIEVIVYPYGTLGTSDHVTEQLHMGTLQLAMASPGHLGKLIPEVQAFLLHYVLSDDEAVNQRALRDPEVVALMRELYADKGLRFMDAFAEGWMVWTTKREVRAPEDFSGVKIRVMTTPLLLEAYRAYGASPTPLPYSEVYSALQLNMIDAQVNPIFAIEEMSFYEVTSHLVFANQAQFYTTVIANPEFYDQLSPGDRALLDETVDELHDAIFEIQGRYNAERLEAMRARKPELRIIELTSEERAAFADRAEGVHASFLSSVGPRGQRLVAVLDAAVGRAQRALDAGEEPASEDH
jgi:tripartite ATP-independent transporter DctP family solute receptor